jgi:hypothetical protein
MAPSEGQPGESHRAGRAVFIRPPAARTTPAFTAAAAALRDTEDGGYLILVPRLRELADT